MNAGLLALLEMAGQLTPVASVSSTTCVGRTTTLAVVQSIFLVIMADALFSIVFSEVDI